MLRFLQVNLRSAPRTYDLALQNSATLTGLISDVLLLSEIPRSAAASASAASLDGRASLHTVPFDTFCPLGSGGRDCRSPRHFCIYFPQLLPR